MTMWPRARTALLLLMVGGAVAGCGDDDGEVGAGAPSDTTASDTTAPADPGTVTADLRITVTVADSADSGQTALLECDGATATGNLWLEGDAAAAACRALGDPEVRAALEPPPADQVCAEVYGGPSVATVVGTVDGTQVDAVVDRTDACGIARWDALAALLPEPADP